MFTRKDQLRKKGGPEERTSYLRELKNEFETSKSYEAKKQVLANLANFAYDPINYEFIKKLRIIDIFLDQLSGDSAELQSFALGGLCNLCIDAENSEYIIRHNGVSLIGEFLLHDDEEISLNALTILIYLCTPHNHHLIATNGIINKVIQYQQSPNRRLKNLGSIFLEDCCTPEEIKLAKQYV